jgi:Ca-activated chloride channel homolog
MVAELAMCAMIVLAAAAEWLHARRVRRVAPLAFGPSRRPELWTVLAPALRVLSMAGLTWGLLTLLTLGPSSRETKRNESVAPRHLLLVLDVSPSMHLKDAGPTRNQTRMRRAAEVMESFIARVPIELYKVSVLGFYSEAKPVVVDTTDLEVVRNILYDLPMSFAFKAGETDLYCGLNGAADLCKGWAPGSTTMVLVTDGVTVPATNMPKRPPAVANVLVIGVGDDKVGTYIDGQQSRQDVSTLRQVAARLGGKYHNGNNAHLATTLLDDLTRLESRSVFSRLTKREYALIACGLGAFALAILPVVLHRWGTRWRPGVVRRD